MSAAAIARNLHAQRQGRNWRCPCPLGCGYGLSLADGEDGRLLVHCFGGCEFDAVMTALVEYGLLDDSDTDLEVVRPLVDPHGRAEDAQRRIQFARELYRQAADDERIGVYLHSRAITISSPVLRFLEARHRLGVVLPSVAAPVVDVNGAQIGIHLTFIKADGTGKANLGKDFTRQCHGTVKGGTIRLAACDPGRELLISEGVETTLAAMEIFKRPGWAAIYASNLKEDLVLPPEVRSVVVAADNDESGTGQKNALAAKQRWISEGRAVRIVIPPRIGTDFNGFLMGRTNGAG